MQKLLLLFFLFFSQLIFAQRGLLYIKKRGFKKVRTFEEGSGIRIQTKTNQIDYGVLTLVKKDSVFVNGNSFAVKDIKTIFLKKKGERAFPTETFLWTTGGVILSTAGMTFAKWTGFEKAVAWSAALGYGNLLIRYFPGLKRKKYKIGGKFSLQTLDLHF